MEFDDILAVNFSTKMQTGEGTSYPTTHKGKLMCSAWTHPLYTEQGCQTYDICSEIEIVATCRDMNYLVWCVTFYVLLDGFYIFLIKFYMFLGRFNVLLVSFDVLLGWFNVLLGWFYIFLGTFYVFLVKFYIFLG